MVLVDARSGGEPSKKRRREAPEAEAPKKRKGATAQQEGAEDAEHSDRDKDTKQRPQGGAGEQQQKQQQKETKKKNKKKKQQVSSKKRAKVKQDVSLADVGGALHSWFQQRYETDGAKLTKIELYPGLHPFSEADFWALESAKRTLVGLKAHLVSKKTSAALIVTRSAIRACELLKTLSVLQRPVGKLFAKHMKLEEQVKYLEGPGSELDAAVGTPNRILKLAEKSSLSTFLANPDSVVVFDLDRDVKNYHILSMPAVSSDAFLLLRKFWLPLKPSERAKIAIFADEQI